jgi:hypothetical protein
MGEFFGYIYFIRNETTGHIKVGYSIHPKKRLVDLRREAQAPLTLLATVASHRYIETPLHHVLKDTRHHGEWFTPSPLLDACIALCDRVPEGVCRPHFYRPGASYVQGHWFLEQAKLLADGQPVSIDWMPEGRAYWGEWAGLLGAPR